MPDCTCECHGPDGATVTRGCEKCDHRDAEPVGPSPIYGSYGAMERQCGVYVAWLEKNIQRAMTIPRGLNAPKTEETTMGKYGKHTADVEAFLAEVAEWDQRWPREDVSQAAEDAAGRINEVLSTKARNDIWVAIPDNAPLRGAIRDVLHAIAARDAVDAADFLTLTAPFAGLSAVVDWLRMDIGGCTCPPVAGVDQRDLSWSHATLCPSYHARERRKRGESAFPWRQGEDERARVKAAIDGQLAREAGAPAAPWACPCCGGETVIENSHLRACRTCAVFGGLKGTVPKVFPVSRWDHAGALKRGHPAPLTADREPVAPVNPPVTCHCHNLPRCPDHADDGTPVAKPICPTCHGPTEEREGMPVCANPGKHAACDGFGWPIEVLGAAASMATRTVGAVTWNGRQRSFQDGHVPYPDEPGGYEAAMEIRGDGLEYRPLSRIADIPPYEPGPDVGWDPEG